jgi:hypothetical protein
VPVDVGQRLLNDSKEHGLGGERQPLNFEGRQQRRVVRGGHLHEVLPFLNVNPGARDALAEVNRSEYTLTP